MEPLSYSLDCEATRCALSMKEVPTSPIRAHIRFDEIRAEREEAELQTTNDPSLYAHRLNFKQRTTPSYTLICIIGYTNTGVKGGC